MSYSQFKFKREVNSKSKQKTKKIFTLRPFERSRRSYQTVNTKINKFKDFTEIIHYGEPFVVGFGKHDFYLVNGETGEKINNRKRKDFGCA